MKNNWQNLAKIKPCENYQLEFRIIEKSYLDSSVELKDWNFEFGGSIEIYVGDFNMTWKLDERFHDQIEWRYNLNGWLTREEVTGNEKADYWLAFNSSEELSTIEDLEINYEPDGCYDIADNIKDYLDYHDEIVLVKPMRIEQPPQILLENLK